MDLEINKKKLIAQIALSGLSVRYTKELVQMFIDSGEIIESDENGEKILNYNKEYFKDEKQSEILNEEESEILNEI